jgi:hypothetical protein
MRVETGMRALYDLGYRIVATGAPWATSPPGLQAEAHP